MSNEVTLFESEEFGQVRVVVGPDGDPWFMASDVAKVLGYTNPQKAVRDHCKNSQLLWVNDSFGRRQNVTIIPESDVYRLIMRSRLPQAGAFQDWVTIEILPSIRKHGMYATGNFVEKALADPASMIQVLQQLQTEQQARKAAEIEKEHAIKTKAHISNKKTATAMATASHLKRENKKLRDRMGISETYRQVRSIKWLLDIFEHSEGMYIAVGKSLSVISREMDLPVRQNPSARYGHVNIYHVAAVNRLHEKVINNPYLFAKYRRENTRDTYKAEERI